MRQARRREAEALRQTNDRLCTELVTHKQRHGQRVAVSTRSEPALSFLSRTDHRDICSFSAPARHHPALSPSAPQADHARRVLAASDRDNDPAATLAPYVSDDRGNEPLFDRLRSLMDPTAVQQRDLALSRLRLTALTDADWQPSEEEQKSQQVNQQLTALASQRVCVKFCTCLARVSLRC